MAVAHDVPEILLLVKDSDRLSAEHVAEVSPSVAWSHACMMTHALEHLLKVVTHRSRC